MGNLVFELLVVCILLFNVLDIFLSFSEVGWMAFRVIYKNITEDGDVF